MIRNSHSEYEREHHRLRILGLKFPMNQLSSMSYPPRLGSTLEGKTTRSIMENMPVRKSCCTLEIVNRLEVSLDDPHYFSYGACRSPMPGRIAPFTVEAFGFSDTPGDCTRGVCSYRIQGTDLRLAVMYSITFASFALGFVPADTPIDYSFYYNARKKEDWDGKADKKRGSAHAGPISVESGRYRAVASMSESKRALINIEIAYTDPSDQYRS